MEHTPISFHHIRQRLDGPLAGKYHSSVLSSTASAIALALAIPIDISMAILGIQLIRRLGVLRAESTRLEKPPHPRQVLMVKAVFQDRDEGGRGIVAGKEIFVSVLRGGLGFEEEDFGRHLGWRVVGLVEGDVISLGVIPMRGI